MTKKAVDNFLKKHPEKAKELRSEFESLLKNDKDFAYMYQEDEFIPWIIDNKMIQENETK